MVFKCGIWLPGVMLALLSLPAGVFSAGKSEPVKVKPPVARVVRDDEAQTSANAEPPPAKGDIETTIRVQIFLDEHNFGPGKIDGKIGEFTLKAGQIFNQVHGIPKDDWTTILKASQKLVTATYAAYRLQENPRSRRNTNTWVTGTSRNLYQRNFTPAWNVWRGSIQA